MSTSDPQTPHFVTLLGVDEQRSEAYLDTMNEQHSQQRRRVRKMPAGPAALLFGQAGMLWSLR